MVLHEGSRSQLTILLPRTKKVTYHIIIFPDTVTILVVYISSESLPSHSCWHFLPNTNVMCMCMKGRITFICRHLLLLSCVRSRLPSKAVVGKMGKCNGSLGLMTGLMNTCFSSEKLIPFKICNGSLTCAICPLHPIHTCATCHRSLDIKVA